MSTHKSLGRGLGSLIPSKTLDKKLYGDEAILSTKEKVVEIEVGRIKPNPHQPRQAFDQFTLADLVASIKTHGIISPLIVSETKEGYQLISGERRLRAAKLLGLKKVPVIIRGVSEQEKLELALTENVQRKDLNPIEKAIGYQKLIDEFNLTQEEIAKKVGLNRASIANTLRLLTLPTEIQRSLAEERLTEGHAKVILGVKNKDEQLKIFKEILRHNLSVRLTEGLARKVTVRKYQRSLKDPVLQEKENRLQEVLGTKVVINKLGRGGRIVVEYYSEEELNEIIRKIIK